MNGATLLAFVLVCLLLGLYGSDIRQLHEDRLAKEAEQQALQKRVDRLEMILLTQPRIQL